MGRPDLDGIAAEPALPEKGTARRVGAVLPRPAEIAGNAEPDKRPEMRPVVDVIAVARDGIGPEAIGAVIPDPVMDQRTARVAPRVGMGGGVLIFKRGQAQVERVVSLQDRLSRRRRRVDQIMSVFIGEASDLRGGLHPLRHPVGKGRVHPAVARPGRIKGIPHRVMTAPARKADPLPPFRSRKGDVLRRGRGPYKAFKRHSFLLSPIFRRSAGDCFF